VTSPTVQGGHRDLHWLAVFPPSRVRFAVWAKGATQRCANFPEALKPQLAFCKDDKNAGGREAYVIADFSFLFYDRLPRYTLAVQDDSYRPADPAVPDSEEILAFYDRFAALVTKPEPAWQEWLATAEAAPFANSDLCVCEIVSETGWSETAGYIWFAPMTWIIESLLGYDRKIRELNATRFPHEATFVFPRSAVHTRPLLLYSVLVQLLNGTAEDKKPDGGRAAPDTPLTHGQWSMLELANVLERLWFVIFDPAFSPDQRVYDARLAAALGGGAGAVEGEGAALLEVRPGFLTADGISAREG